MANLLLARGVSREREVAVRAALGAGRRRIAAQFLVESALLAAAGGVGGIFAGYWGLKALVRFAPPDVPRNRARAHRPAGPAVLDCPLCRHDILAGLVPAWQAAARAAGAVVPPSSRGTAGDAANRPAAWHPRGGRNGAGHRAADGRRAPHPQLQPHRTRGSRPCVARTAHDAALPAQDPLRGAAADCRRLRPHLDAVRRVPGVVRRRPSAPCRLGGGGFYLGRVFLREGQAEPPATTDTAGAWSVIRPDYFATAGMPMVEGRAFTRATRRRPRR